MNKNKELVVIKSFIKDIRYKMPIQAKELDKITVKKISNAIGNGIVDTKGIIWFDCSKLHTILRVKSKRDAAYILESIDNKYKANYNNIIYIRWSSLIGIIAKRIEENPKNEYLKLIFRILEEINNSSDIKVLQHAAIELQKKNIRKLKKDRIKTFNIVRDELTNERLDRKNSEFSHIRSVTMFPELSEYIWNGLIVNKTTHNLITSENVNDEEELYKLCYKNQWNTEWYNDYKLNVDNYNL